MLLSVMDDLRTNTLSKVREIRVSNIWKREFHHKRRAILSRLHHAFPFVTTSSSLVSQDVMGFNSAALQFLQREIESKEDVMFFADATGQLKDKKKKRRKRERAILTIA